MRHTLYSLVKEHAAKTAIDDPNTDPECCQGPCSKRVAETLSYAGGCVKEEMPVVSDILPSVTDSSIP